MLVMLHFLAPPGSMIEGRQAKARTGAQKINKDRKKKTEEKRPKEN